MPSQAQMEDLDLCLEIIELRAYAQAKHAVETAKDDDRLPKTPLVLTVWEIQNDILQEINAARLAAAEAKAAEGPERTSRRQRLRKEAKLREEAG